MGATAWEKEIAADKPIKMSEPNQYAACYTLDLYCDHYNKAHNFDEFPHQYYLETFGECATEARRDGWMIHRNRTATCPKCSGKIRA